MTKECIVFCNVSYLLDKKKTKTEKVSDTPSEEDYEGDFKGDYENNDDRSTTVRSRRKPSRSRLEVMKIKSTTERNIEVDEVEKVRDPIRIHNPLSIIGSSVSIGGKPSRGRNTAKDTKKLRQRTKINNQRKHKTSGRSYDISCIRNIQCKMQFI